MAPRNKKHGRSINGILLLDKPAGSTSNQVLQKVKRLYHANRAGHSGNLDGPATGMLPICLGWATKCCQYLLDADKCYRAICRLGVRTNTADMSGSVIDRGAIPVFDKAKLSEILQGFCGEVSQIPPMYSAIKHQGRRLYELAGKGEVVERKARTVRIHEIHLLSIAEETFEIDVRCSKGTYIRVLAEDIAVALGSIGCLDTLRRIYSSPFNEDRMYSLEELEEVAEEGGHEALDALLLAPERALPDWSEVQLPPEIMRYFFQGQAVTAPNLPRSGLVRVHDRNGRMVAIGEMCDDGRVTPRKIMV
ncbi:MAG: tRNA pseudouridine(55) synthase TruB [Candidatus Eutrophobiaceae bacterium]